MLSNHKKILQLAWPLIVANSFWNIQITVDRVFLGQFSTDALGAAVAVMGIFWTPMALLQQTAAYTTTFVAQYLGANEKDKIGPVVWQAIFLSLIGGFLFFAMPLVSRELFTWIGHSPNLLDLEVEYFDSLSYSALPATLVAVASGFFTGLGLSQVILMINGVGVLANVILDYLLIFGHWGFPELGIRGAGYATAMANWVSALVGLYLLWKKDKANEFSFRKKISFNLELMKRFLKYGLPSGLQWSLEGLAFTVFLIIIGRMEDGAIALASSGIATTIMLLAILPPMGVAQAVSVLVGQHLGEGRPQQAEKDTWCGLHLAFFYIFLASLSFLLVPEFYLRWFHNDGNQIIWNQVQTLASHLLYFVAFFTLFDSMNFVISFALKGAGDTRFVSLVALTLPWPLMVLPTWLTTHWNGAIYWAWGWASFYLVTQALVFVFRFRGGKWKKMSVIH